MKASIPYDDCVAAVALLFTEVCPVGDFPVKVGCVTDPVTVVADAALVAVVLVVVGLAAICLVSTPTAWEWLRSFW